MDPDVPTGWRRTEAEIEPAYHEAAHAVAGHLLGFTIHGVLSMLGEAGPNAFVDFTPAFTFDPERDTDPRLRPLADASVVRLRWMARGMPPEW